MSGGGFWVAVLVLSISIAVAAAEDDGGAYEALRAHGLPIGLLPKGVTRFSLGEDGRFEAVIGRPCTARWSESGVRYETNISGELSYGQIASLSGVSAQDLFLWFPVRDIFVLDRRSGVIFFDVGVVQKQFPLSLFETPPDCEPDPPAAKVPVFPQFHHSGPSLKSPPPPDGLWVAEIAAAGDRRRRWERREVA